MVHGPHVGYFFVALVHFDESGQDSHLSEPEARPSVDPFPPAVLRKLVLSLALVGSSAAAIGTTAMSAITFVALCFLGLAFLFYALHDVASTPKLRTLAFVASILCSFGAVVAMMLKLLA